MATSESGSGIASPIRRERGLQRGQHSTLAASKSGDQFGRAGTYGEERDPGPYQDEVSAMSIETPRTQFKSPKEIATLCDLSPRAIYRAISRGELRASRLCG